MTADGNVIFDYPAFQICLRVVFCCVFSSLPGNKTRLLSGSVFILEFRRREEVGKCRNERRRSRVKRKIRESGKGGTRRGGGAGRVEEEEQDVEEEQGDWR